MFNSSNLKRIICGFQLFAGVGSTVFNFRFYEWNNIRRNKSNERVDQYFTKMKPFKKKNKWSYHDDEFSLTSALRFSWGHKKCRFLRLIAYRAFRIVITKWANLLKNQLKNVLSSIKTISPQYLYLLPKFASNLQAACVKKKPTCSAFFINDRLRKICFLTGSIYSLP